jgi:hypothetical protein
MQPIRFNCPSCGVPLKFDAPPPEGKKFHCPKCKANIKVSGKKDSPTAAKPGHEAHEPALDPVAGHPAPAPALPRISVEPASAEHGRAERATFRGPAQPAQGASDLLWKVVAGSIGVIMAACLLALAFWSYIPK